MLPDLKLGHGAKDVLCKVIIFALNRAKGATHVAYLRGGSCSFLLRSNLFYKFSSAKSLQGTE